MLIKASQEARTSRTADLTDAQNYISNMAQAGLNASSIPQETKSKYEQSLGLPAGTFDKFYSDVQIASQFQKEGRYADFTKKISDILKEIPKGQTITIGGQTYQGLGSTGTATAGIQEYEYAKSQGYAGSFTDYQNEDANRKEKSSWCSWIRFYNTKSNYCSWK